MYRTWRLKNNTMHIPWRITDVLSLTVRIRTCWNIHANTWRTSTSTLLFLSETIRSKLIKKHGLETYFLCYRKRLCTQVLCFRHSFGIPKSNNNISVLSEVRCTICRKVRTKHRTHFNIFSLFDSLILPKFHNHVFYINFDQMQYHFRLLFLASEREGSESLITTYLDHALSVSKKTWQLSICNT